MGAECACRATIEGVDREGKAWLEGDHVLFRGDGYRIKLPLSPMEESEGQLKLGRAVLHLGDHAAKWAEKIRNPKSLLDKLGVKPGLSVVVLGVKDEAFLAQISEAGKRLKQNVDLVFLGAETPVALERLEEIRGKLAPAGAVWIVYPKGVKTITQVDVMRATQAAGLVDVKVAAFSATHTALKAVIPKLAR